MRLSPPLRLAAVAGVLMLASLAAGCGLIFGGTRQTIRASSSPEGATLATAPSTVEHTTPTTLSLERKTEYVLTVSMPGYSSATVELQRSIRGGIVVLDVLAGLVGVIIDAATGAWYQLKPDVVNVSLTKLSAGTPGPDTVTVTVSTERTPSGADVRIRSTVPGVIVEAHPQ